MILLWVLFSGAKGMAQTPSAILKVQIQPVIECGVDRDGRPYSRAGVVAIRDGVRYPVEFPEGVVRPASLSSGRLESSGTLEGGVFRPQTLYPAAPSTVILPPRRRMLLIFVNFSDLRWDPGQKQEMMDAMGGVPDFIARNSRGRMQVGISDFHEEITINATSGSLAGLENGQILALVSNLALAGLAENYPDIAATTYHHIAFAIPRLGYLPFFGYAEPMGSGQILNGPQRWQVVVHEIGHNLGLYHADAWHSHDPEDPVSANGVLVGFGDAYDVMGDFLQGKDFNVAFKHQLGWIQEGEVTQVTESGEYTLHRHDHEGATGPMQGLVVGYGTTFRYWLEYRRNAVPGYQVDGVLIRRAAPIFGEAHAAVGSTQLLDMNDQGRTNDFTDSPLTLGEGKIFKDPAQGVEVRVLGYGGEEPNQFVRVRVDVTQPPSLPAPPSVIIHNLTNNQVLPIFEPFAVSADVTTNAHLISRIELWVNGRTNPPAAIGNADQRVFEWIPSQVGVNTVRLRTFDIHGRVSDSRRLAVNVTWEPRPVVPGTLGMEVRNLTPGPSGWVAFIGGELAFSTDPFNWTSAVRTPVPGVEIKDIASSGGTLVAVGWGGIRFSRDGRSWQPGAVEGEVFLEKVVSFRNRWFAVGRQGVVLQSEDGSSWSAIPVNVSDDFVGLAVSANELVAMGARGIRIRFDGQAWGQPAVIQVESPVSIAGLTYGDGRFLAWGSAGALFSSRLGVAWDRWGYKEGMAWDSRSYPGETNCVFGGSSGILYAVGASNVWFLGSLGAPWTKLLDRPANSPVPNHQVIGWGNHLLLTSLGNGSTSFAVFEGPPDLYRHWSAQEFGDADHSEALPEADPDQDGRQNLMEYAIGAEPRVPESGRDLDLVFSRPGWVSFDFRFTERRPDVRYMVESSPDLRHWTVECEFPIREAELRDQPRFYRLRMERTPL